MKKLVFHIGHHKTATTWLQSGFFCEHTQIRSITDYRHPWEDKFLNYLIATTERSFNLSQCRELLNEKLFTGENESIKINIVSAERLSGHPYSGGYDSYILANRIYSCFPEAKIIIGIRNQIDMVNSAYKQLITEGFPGTFKDFLESKHWKGTSFSLDMFKFELLISQYIKLFSRENVLILLYEDLLVDNKDFIRQISNFLDVDYFEPSNLERKDNITRKNSNIQVMRFFNYFLKTELNPYPLIELNPKVINILRKPMCRLVKEKQIINDEQVIVLKKYYYESNIVLRNILQKDLNSYP